MERVWRCAELFVFLLSHILTHTFPFILHILHHHGVWLKRRSALLKREKERDTKQVSVQINRHKTGRELTSQKIP